MNQTENELFALRQQHLALLKQQKTAYINHFKPSHTSQALHQSFDESSKQDLATQNVNCSVAGRVMLKRAMGKSSFISIQDKAGIIQAYIRQDTIGESEYEDFKKVDLGDIVGVTGTLFKTNTGELSVNTTQLVLISKSLRPLPDKHKGLNDTEIRYRQRYLDLITNPKSRDRFVTRTKIINQIRQFFISQDFLEVETPMMHSIPGGANARPFITHHNALDMQLYLRIAPELHLKRLLVGGLDRVFEINRNFRNEGVSTSHNPEFTMLEFYQAYADYIDAMTQVENLLHGLAKLIDDSGVLAYQEHSISYQQPFTRLSLADAVLQYNPELNPALINDNDALQQYASTKGIATKQNWGWGKTLSTIFEETVEDKLIQPTFITHYPTEISPLARVNDKNPEITDRFELFIAGFEIANGFSELNDPEIQAATFKQQQQSKADGDDEAMFYDSEYITALEYGMPPAAGTGIGIDRLVMLLTNAKSIRDVLLFPLMRHK